MRRMENKNMEENIEEQVRDYNLTILKIFGISQEDATIFLDIAEKIKVPEHEQKSFDDEFDEGIPFEGGMMFSEVLTALKDMIE
jgi:hypothetical protein